MLLYSLFLSLSAIWQIIQERKTAISMTSEPGAITDINDGEEYRNLLQSGFLHDPANLTCVFNTDGINLYSSSRVELWPIFLAINELPPSLRFSRKNVILAGIWQGKGKPPFQAYMSAFSEMMNDLYHNGVQVSFGDTKAVAKLAVIGGTFGLPAKAGILSMSYFNGAEACITCEEPGVMVRQGKGHARHYPFRDEQERFPLRTCGGVQQCMSHSSERKRVKGFRGISGLVSINSLDLVKGIVPDYMHGILLGVTKNLLHMWFSPTGSGQEYFIGKHLRQISIRLQNIKPPDYIERLPRDLEKHYTSLKATELQTWLLYYGIPCVKGFLADNHLEHFSLLSEATYILLGENITQSAIQRATKLLHLFYQQFSTLYKTGSCGLNVHNLSHLCYYVQQMGPLWAWSCFAFEDCNAMILQSVHGTGCVMKQVLRFKQAQSVLNKATEDSAGTRKKMWRTLVEADGCAVAGSLQPFHETGLDGELERHGLLNTDLKKVSRVMNNGQKLYSELYTRMQKRIANVVLLEGNDRFGFVQYFLMCVESRRVYAVVRHLQKVSVNLAAGHHLVPVRSSEVVKLYPISSVLETVVYVSVNDREAYVARVPNKHGHAIFK